MHVSSLVPRNNISITRWTAFPCVPRHLVVCASVQHLGQKPPCRANCFPFGILCDVIVSLLSFSAEMLLNCGDIGRQNLPPPQEAAQGHRQYTFAYTYHGPVLFMRPDVKLYLWFMQGLKALYPPDGGTDSVQVVASDLARLDPDEFLNDTIIDFFIKWA